MESAVKSEFRQMLDVFVDKNVDFLLAEFFSDVVEAEWAIECIMEALGRMEESGGGSGGGSGSGSEERRPAVGVTMSIGPMGDFSGISPQECAIRLKRAGLSVTRPDTRHEMRLVRV